MGELLIQPLGTLSRELEGAILRALLGMLVKRRTNESTEFMEVSYESYERFISKYTVGVTADRVKGTYMITIQERQHHGASLGILSQRDSAADVECGRAGGQDIHICG